MRLDSSSSTLSLVPDVYAVRRLTQRCGKIPVCLCMDPSSATTSWGRGSPTRLSTNCRAVRAERPFCHAAHWSAKACECSWSISRPYAPRGRRRSPSTALGSAWDRIVTPKRSARDSFFASILAPALHRPRAPRSAGRRSLNSSLMRWRRLEVAYTRTFWGGSWRSPPSTP